MNPTMYGILNGAPDPEFPAVLFDQRIYGPAERERLSTDWLETRYARLDQDHRVLQAAFDDMKAQRQVDATARYEAEKKLILLRTRLGEIETVLASDDGYVALRADLALARKTVEAQKNVLAQRNADIGIANQRARLAEQALAEVRRLASQRGPFLRTVMRPLYQIRRLLGISVA